MICSSRFLKRLSCNTRLMATISDTWVPEAATAGLVAEAAVVAAATPVDAPAGEVVDEAVDVVVETPVPAEEPVVPVVDA